MTSSGANKLTNLQRELIKVFSIELNESQILDIRELLTQYFAEMATKEMDRLWDEKGWTEDTMKEWASEHIRSKSKKP